MLNPHPHHPLPQSSDASTPLLFRPQYEGPGTVADVFGLAFAVEEEAWGVRREVDLVPGGAQVPVTERNRHK